MEIKSVGTLRIKSFEENSEYFYKYFKKTRQESYDFSFFKNTELFLEYAFVPSKV